MDSNKVIEKLHQENQKLKEKLKDIKNNYRRQIDSLLIERLNLFKQLKQSQKQLAIDKLETLQNSIIIFKQAYSDTSLTINYVEQIINNQIKKLKGEE